MLLSLGLQWKGLPRVAEEGAIAVEGAVPAEEAAGSGGIAGRMRWVTAGRLLWTVPAAGLLWMVSAAGILHTVSAVGLSVMMKGEATAAGELLQIRVACWLSRSISSCQLGRQNAD